MVHFRLLSFSMLVLFAIACGEDEPTSTPTDGGLAFEPPPSAWPPGCAMAEGEYLPRTLECTGLYRGSLTNRELADGVRPFKPAASLWSDGAEKLRWIALPPNTQIDSSNPAEWTFPVGTKLWKEFRKHGHRIETRLFFKESADNWKRATYVWRDGEKSAPIWEERTGVPNVITLSDGSEYQLPTRVECNECHKGRKDKVLGFEPLLLGMRGAEGLDLARLVAENLLSHPPGNVHYQIPDDGTRVGADAIAYLHVNCGVSCHNENAIALGYPTGMFLRLDPGRLGEPMAAWNPLRTTWNVPAHISNFAGEVRIVPGAPRASLIVGVTSVRGTNRQMPPLGTRFVDQRGVVLITDWIARMRPSVDGGVPATPTGIDAGVGPVI
jgi:hypothetical protein